VKYSLQQHVIEVRGSKLRIGLFVGKSKLFGVLKNSIQLLQQHRPMYLSISSSVLA